MQSAECALGRVPYEEPGEPGRDHGAHDHQVDLVLPHLRGDDLDDVAPHQLEIDTVEPIPERGHAPRSLGHSKVQRTARHAYLAWDSVKTWAGRVAESLLANLIIEDNAPGSAS